MAVIDFTTVEDSSFEALPVGTYHCCVTGIEATTFSSGNSGWKVTYTVQDQPYQSRKLFDNLVLTSKALWKIRDFISACTREKPTGQFNFNPEDYQGKHLLVSVIHEEYPKGSGTMTDRTDTLAPYDENAQTRQTIFGTL